MNNKELEHYFFKKINLIYHSVDHSTEEKIQQLHLWFEKLFLSVTDKEKFNFSSMFSRISFVGSKYGFSKNFLFFIHKFRHLKKDEINKDGKRLLSFGHTVFHHLIFKIFNGNLPQDLPELDSFSFSQFKHKEKFSSIRVFITDYNEAEDYFLGNLEKNSAERIKIKYNASQKKELFKNTIATIKKVLPKIIKVNLLDVKVGKNNTYFPNAVVLEPDLLLDVTAISSCYSNKTPSFLIHLIKKFIPVEMSKFLMIGNIANSFLDALIQNPESNFEETFKALFVEFPLQFAVMKDKQLMELYSLCKGHFFNLQNVVKENLPENGISIENIHLEPSFISDEYGIQGRLDLFHQKPNQNSIVELKSGSAFNPNIHGIGQSHFRQTILYDLMISSVYEQDIANRCFILYSKDHLKPLKFAPIMRSEQYDTLDFRNRLINIELTLAKLQASDTEHVNIIDYIHPNNFGKKGFTAQDLERFHSVFKNLPILEAKYFLAYVGFITREFLLSKSGYEGPESNVGNASLWLNSDKQKEEQFKILNNLVFINLEKENQDVVLHLKKSETTTPIANFRKGDMAVIYPYRNEKKPTNNQLIKGNIVAIDEEKIEILLRSKQVTKTYFGQYEHWNLEHDNMDAGFTKMYRSIFIFLEGNRYNKNLILGITPPKPPIPKTIKIYEGLLSHQQETLEKMIVAQDYFLLWGPPGTGKTSKMLSSYIDHQISNSKAELLVIAYTNRAVDEICESLIEIGLEKHLIRIGSRFSTHGKYKHLLMQSKIDKIGTRKELVSILKKHQITVGTLASISGKSELFKLKEFGEIIVDEASQILEPQLVGLLGRFKKFVLIGDHKQLPAVVKQNKEASKIADQKLLSIGLTNLSNSLFERLFNRCAKNNWNHAYAQLEYQGRMHEDIMAFPNQAFYDGKLKILPKELGLTFQTKPLVFKNPNIAIKHAQIKEKRIHFFPVVNKSTQLNNKVNEEEAILAIDIIKDFIALYGDELDLKDLGIITPFRAQIALIQQMLEKEKLGKLGITIDTVERYQGGARKIIIISLAVSNPFQLNSIISTSEDGIDRKLNVAMTRAKDHLIIIGNPEVLKYDNNYNKLIKFCKS